MNNLIGTIKNYNDLDEIICKQVFTYEEFDLKALILLL